VKKFDAIREDGGDVKKLKFKNELEEISWIIDDIVDKIENDIPANSIAIITKKNKTLELIAK
jgi:superfamily I DNA/RNA helicase